MVWVSVVVGVFDGMYVLVLVQQIHTHDTWAGREF